MTRDEAEALVNRLLAAAEYWQFEGGWPLLTATDEDALAFREVWGMAVAGDWWAMVTTMVNAVGCAMSELPWCPERTALLRQAWPLFADPDTGLARPGREEGWHLVVEDLQSAAYAEDDIPAAVRLRRAVVAQRRRQGTPKDLLDAVHSLAYALKHAGDHPAQAEVLIEAWTLSRQLGERLTSGLVAQNLGWCHLALGDLDAAERWARTSIEEFEAKQSKAPGTAILAKAALLRGNFAEAEAHCLHALERYPSTPSDHDFIHQVLLDAYDHRDVFTPDLDAWHRLLADSRAKGDCEAADEVVRLLGLALAGRPEAVAGLEAYRHAGSYSWAAFRLARSLFTREA
jgi:tetratricopeptide (TPR) repeat protein